MDNTLNKVKSILAKHLGFSKDNIKENTKLIDDLHADSLDMVEIILALEDEFSINIPDKAMESFNTPKDIVNYLKTYYN